MDSARCLASPPVLVLPVCDDVLEAQDLARLRWPQGVTAAGSFESSVRRWVVSESAITGGRTLSIQRIVGPIGSKRAHTCGCSAR